MYVYLLLSALFVNGIHGYLLWSQRYDRRRSISSHAAKDKQAYLLYMISHFLGGFFFLLFAHKLYVNIYGVAWLFYLVILGIFFEYVQAVIPAKGKTEKAHAFFAYSMFITYLLSAAIALVILPVAMLTRSIVTPIIILIIVMGYYANKYRDKMYLPQMVAISSFCLAMLVITLGSL